MVRPGRQWLVVLACAGLAVLPQRVREQLRGLVLDATTRGGEGKTSPDKERELANQVALLEAEKADLLRSLREVGASRTLAPEAGLIPAEAFPLAGPQDLARRLALGRGERDGISKDAPVLASKALVGTVIETTRDRAKVRLVTDPAFRLRVREGRTGIEGMLSGTGSSRTLVFVPAPSGDDDPLLALRPGDQLVVSRASTLVNVEAVVGVVRELERAPGEGGLRVLATPAANVAQLTRVVVLRMGHEEGGIDAPLVAHRKR